MTWRSFVFQGEHIRRCVEQLLPSRNHVFRFQSPRSNEGRLVGKRKEVPWYSAHIMFWVGRLRRWTLALLSSRSVLRTRRARTSKTNQISWEFNEMALFHVCCLGWSCHYTKFVVFSMVQVLYMLVIDVTKEAGSSVFWFGNVKRGSRWFIQYDSFRTCWSTSIHAKTYLKISNELGYNQAERQTGL